MSPCYYIWKIDKKAILILYKILKQYIRTNSPKYNI